MAMRGVALACHVGTAVRGNLGMHALRPRCRWPLPQRRPACVTARWYHVVTVPDEVVFHGDEKTTYTNMFPQLVSDLATDYSDIPDANEWLGEVMRCNVLGGPDTTAKLFLLSHHALALDGHPCAANRMAWCLQVLEGSFLVCNELMQKDESRPEQLRWHRRSDLGARAVNDGVLLESSTYELLFKYFQDQPYLMSVVNLFQQVTHMVVLGRCLDLRASEASSEDRLQMLTAQYLQDIARHLTAYLKVYLPLQLAATMGGYNEPQPSSELSELILRIGIFSHYQEDVLSYVEGMPSGATAIEQGRCTWPAVTTLQRATLPQTRTFQECYGRPGQENVSAIMEIYRQVGIGDLFFNYKREEVKNLASRIEKIQDKKMQDVLQTFLEIFSMQTTK